jgi:hypothetical protein
MSEDGSEAGALSRADRHQARGKKLERLSSGDSSVVGVKLHKVCCVCGELLNHKPRFKDHEGRYWCPSCNEADHQKVRPIPCADCGIEMSRLDMKEVNGLFICPVCMEKFVNDSKAVAEVRIRALAHGRPTKSTNPMWPIFVVAAMLLIATALLVYRLL